MKKNILGIALLFCASAVFATNYFTHFAVDGLTYKLAKDDVNTAYLDIDQSSKFDFNGISYYHLKKAYCALEASCASGKECSISYEIIEVECIKGVNFEKKFKKDSVNASTNDGLIHQEFDTTPIEQNDWVLESKLTYDSFGILIRPSRIGNKNVGAVSINCRYE